MSIPKHRLTAVSYLNTKPFLYGLKHSGLDNRLEISLEPPSETALRLEMAQAEIGLVPVAALPKLTDYRIITDFCIGTEGKVGTVAIYSQQPIENCTRLILDFQSRTSVAMVKLLLRDFWKIDLLPVSGYPGFEKDIFGNTAGLIIGDRAFEADPVFPYKYDLGEAWVKLTGLPFVFAVWVASPKIDSALESELNSAFELGLSQIDAVVKQESQTCPEIDLERYLKKNISYNLTKNKRAGMSQFLDFVGFKLPNLVGF